MNLVVKLVVLLYGVDVSFGEAFLTEVHQRQTDGDDESHVSVAPQSYNLLANAVSPNDGFDLRFIKADIAVRQNDMRYPLAPGKPQRSARRVAEQ